MHLVGIAPPDTVEGQARAAALTAVARVETAKSADDALGHRMLGHLVGGVPVARVRHPRDREEIRGRPLVVAQDPVQSLVIVRVIKGPIVVVQVRTPEQRAGAETGGAQQKPATVTVGPVS